MADRVDELRETAAQCLALAHSTSDARTRAALLTMAQKLYDRAIHHHPASQRPDEYEAVQREFNDRQMLPQAPVQQPQAPAQQQQQVQPKKKEE